MAHVIFGYRIYSCDRNDLHYCGASEKCVFFSLFGGRDQRRAAVKLALLGDSVFDNAPYVEKDASVSAHLGRMLPAGVEAILMARDGSVIADIKEQVARMPSDVTHVILSVGGNNLLQSLEVMVRPAVDVTSALGELNGMRTRFRADYESMLEEFNALGLPLAVCTIYDSVPGLSAELKTALTIFNDTITRAAMRNKVSVLDLREICSAAGDYSSISQIEPSGPGAGKIALAIFEWLNSQPH